jgi:PAS domain S-box-containing protein
MMTEFLANISIADSFIPHGHCYLWNPELVRLHLVADLTIAIAYFSIPLTLFYFVNQREDLPFNWIFTLFGAFIILCGTTHLLEVWTLWHPVYWLSGGVKAITAVVSAYTAIVLVQLMPQALTLPSPAQLTAANQALQQQIRDRELAEAQIQQLNQELEIRVAHRTQELATSMLEVKDLVERMELAIEGSGIGIYDWNLVTAEIVASGYFKQLFGYSQDEEFTYADWERRLHPEDFVSTTTALQQSRLSLTDYTVEYRVIWADESIHWIAAFGRYYGDSDGRVVRMAGVVNEITARKQSETALRHSEEFNRRILEHNNDCIKVLDLEGRLLYMNDGGKRLLEIDDFCLYQGQWWVQFWNESDQESAKLAIETAKTGEVAKFEGKCPTVKGTPKWWEVVVTPMLDDRGSVEQILSISHDITERIQAEAVMRESEDRFRATFEQAAIGVAHVGLAGKWLRVNQKLCDIVGYTEIELLDRCFQDLTYPDDLAPNLEYIRQLLAGEIETYAMEKRYIHKLGTLVWVNLTASLRRDAAGAPMHFISAIEDISDRKQAEFVLEKKTLELAQTSILVQQRNQDLDQFAHIVSHDLKAPLRAIANLSTWIEEDLEEQINPETQGHLDLMRSRVVRMEAMINGLLEYARVGNTPANLSTFSFEDLLTEIIDSLNIPPSFEVDLPTNLPTITTNRMLLSQVFANLLGNACKHHDRPVGRIQITAQPQGEMWTFTVTDDGPGIAPDNQERVFGVFQTLGARDNQENTGIGLSIVKKIVENQGGKIVVESQLGRGTTFRFSWMKGMSK